MTNEELYKNTLVSIRDMKIDITNIKNAIRDIQMIKALVAFVLAASESK